MLCICITVIFIQIYQTEATPKDKIYWEGDTVTNQYGSVTYVEYTETSAVFDVINETDQPYIFECVLNGYTHNSKEITIYMDGEEISVPRLYPDGKTHRIVIDLHYFTENNIPCKSIFLPQFGYFALSKKEN